MQLVESLTTIIVAVYNRQTEVLDYVIGGDGGVLYTTNTNTDDELAHVDWKHNDRGVVDFFGEHLQSTADLQSWIATQQSASILGVVDFSIMTDGIEAISTLDLPTAMATLCSDKSLLKSHAMLDRKVNIMIRQGAILGDDLTVVRYIK